MTGTPGCSLWIFVARTDAAYMEKTIPHIVSMCDYPFLERVLAIDVAEPSGEKRHRPHLVRLSQTRELCDILVDRGVVDKVVDIDYSESGRRRIYKKHFGVSRIKATHNFKGYPILGSMFCIEECAADYIVHFDSDMLIYQKAGYNWISGGIQRLEADPELLWVRAQAGPEPEMFRGSSGNAVKKASAFASRVYLLDKRKLVKLLPVRPVRVPHGRQGRKKKHLPKAALEIFHYLTGQGILDSWEKIMSRGMREKGLLGGWLFHDNDCWTLHPCDHGHDFIEALPEIIERVERGEYPPEQAGKHDLDLEAWLRFLKGK